LVAQSFSRAAIWDLRSVMFKSSRIRFGGLCEVKQCDAV
jgi:hypothetical protein